MGGETKVENVVLDVVKAAEKEIDSNSNSKPRTCMDLDGESMKNGGGVTGVSKYTYRNMYVCDRVTLSQ